jgi:hypothetical protein
MHGATMGTVHICCDLSKGEKFIYFNVQGVSEYSHRLQYAHIDIWLSLQLSLGFRWLITLYPTPRSVDNKISLRITVLLCYCVRYSSFRFESRQFVP